MNTSERLFNLPNGALFTMLIFVLLASIFMHAAQYITDTPKLFFVVFIARLLAALGAATVIAVAWKVLAKIFKYHGRGIGFWTVFTGSGAIASTVMTILSLNNKVSEGLLLLYY